MIYPRAVRSGLTSRYRKENRMSFVDAVNRKAIELGKLSVEMTTAAGSGHPSTALSLAHLVTVLVERAVREAALRGRGNN